MITVQYPAMNSVTISNVVGQTVISIEFQGSNHEVIDVADLASGVYFITIEANGDTASSKFLKE